MTAPSWHDPVATARREAAGPLARGLAVRPTLIAFEGDEPTLYVRSRLAWHHGDRAMLPRELVALPAMLGPSRLLLVAHGLLSEPGGDDPVLQDATAHRAVTVDVAERVDDGRASTWACVLPYAVDDDGTPIWEAAIELPDGGPWTTTLEHVLVGDHDPDGDGRLGTAGFAYALSRRGAVVAVAPGWCSQYGFDRPVDPRHVRGEDQRRARDGRRGLRHPSPTGRPT